MYTLLEILSNTSLTMSDLLDSIPKYSSTPEVRLDCINDDEKNNIVIKLKEYFINNYACETLDGVRIIFKHGWALIRSSNTQPAIVLRIEADNDSYMNDYKKIVEDKLNEISGYNVNI